MKYKDKIKHLVVSFILALIIFLITKSHLLTIFLVLLLSLIKELSDQRKGKNTNRESFADMSADVVGLTLGILFSQYILL